MIVCGTGHRPDKLGGYGDDVSDRLRSLARKSLEELQPAKVISGMALGWDTALAWGAYDLGIPLLAAVPFEGQESRWPQRSQKIFKELIQLADEVFVVSPGSYAAWKMQVRNEWMVNNSDTVLALWNGTDGGTANCVRYAQRKDKPIINLWQEFKNLKGDNNGDN